MKSQQLPELLDFAVTIAEDAGALTLEHFHAAVTAERKPDNSPVTVADRNAEKLLRNRIETVYPEHGIVGEEFGEKPALGPARWILDPIDGTISFISGVPLYSVLVGLEWEGEMVVGVIHMPALRETVSAARGLGCRWNGRPARVSDVTSLANARLIVTGTKQLYQQNRGDAFERLRDAVSCDRGWSDAYGYALLATGRAEIVLDPLMAIWDVAALVPVVTEAGGTLTDWTGKQDHTRPEVIATNGHLCEDVMRAVRGD